MTRCWTNSPFLIKVARVDSSFYLKMVFFKIAQNVSKYLGYFWIVICCQELLKFAQSGHTSNLKRFIGSTPTPSIQEKFFASFCANRKNMFFEEGQNLFAANFLSSVTRFGEILERFGKMSNLLWQNFCQIKFLFLKMAKCWKINQVTLSLSHSL